MSKSEEREVFEIYAVKYAHNANRTRNGNMLYMDEHDRPMPLDYFVWVIKNDKRTYVVDTGFDPLNDVQRAANVRRADIGSQPKNCVVGFLDNVVDVFFA